ncbi:MAG: tetratricopeptide repeat protein, partial [Deltaproteobacteria bacterium]|nr:tetratricopeptide repeat protein [Deltaproteobacteria bacterium]
KGRLLYDYGHLRAAVKIFGQVVARYSRQASARSAATLILDALHRAGHEDELLRWTKKLAKSPVATPKLKESIRRIELSARFRRASQASEKKKWARCVSGFLAIASQAPKSKWAPMAIHNAAICRREGKNPAAAVALWERLLRTYPRDALAQRARFVLAGLRHLAGRHADAARLYERYAQGAAKGDRQVVSGLLYAVTVAVRKRKRRHAKALVILLRRLAPHDGRALKQAQELLAKLR